MEAELIQRNKKTLNISYSKILLYSTWVFLYVLSTRINYIDILISILEILFIWLCIIMRKYGTAYLCLVLSLSFSFEEKSFVYLMGAGRNLYSIYKLPIVSVFPFYFSTILLFVLVYFRYAHQVYSKLFKNKAINAFFRWLPILFVSGLITGLIAQIANDNGIADYSWSFTVFATSSLRVLSLFCYIGTGFFLVLGKDGFRLRIETSIIECLFSFFIVGSITVLLRWHGYYADLDEIMLMPLASSLCPLLLIIPIFYKVRKPFFYSFSSIFFTIESFFYNSVMGSKFYMIPLLCFLVFILTTLKRSRIKGFLIVIIGISLILINSNSILNIITGSEYGSWKFNQFLKLFNLRGGFSSWYNNVDASPRFRIDEFVNIFLEYCRKPWYSIFGKGIGGSITHTWGTTNWFRNTGTFQDYQIESGIFISMHESLNVLFIRHGIIGLLFFFITFAGLLKKFTSSPWAVGGIVWFTFYWGIYFSWWIGVLMLILVLSEERQNDNWSERLCVAEK